MLILPTNSTSLELVLSGAVTTNELHYTTHFEQTSSQELIIMSSTQGVSTGATDVTIVAAPSAGSIRTIKSISVYNADTASATVQIHYDNNGTERVIIKVTLATLENLFYEDGAGWQVLTTAGAIK